MKLFIVILLLGYIAVATSIECRWTVCEGSAMNARDMCIKYGYTGYANEFDEITCSKWFTRKFKCCRPSPGKCEWTMSCYGEHWWHAEACTNEFSKEYVPASKKDCGRGQTQYECCPKLEDSKAGADEILE